MDAAVQVLEGGDVRLQTVAHDETAPTRSSTIGDGIIPVADNDGSIDPLQDIGNVRAEVGEHRTGLGSRRRRPQRRNAVPGRRQQHHSRCHSHRGHHLPRSSPIQATCTRWNTTVYFNRKETNTRLGIRQRGGDLRGRSRSPPSARSPPPALSHLPPPTWAGSTTTESVSVRLLRPRCQRPGSHTGTARPAATARPRSPREVHSEHRYRRLGSAVAVGGPPPLVSFGAVDTATGPQWLPASPSTLAVLCGRDLAVGHRTGHQRPGVVLRCCTSFSDATIGAAEHGTTPGFAMMRFVTPRTTGCSATAV